jgi:hypothetical protein
MCSGLRGLRSWPARELSSVAVIYSSQVCISRRGRSRGQRTLEASHVGLARGWRARRAYAAGARGFLLPANEAVSVDMRSRCHGEGTRELPRGRFAGACSRRLALRGRARAVARQRRELRIEAQGCERNVARRSRAAGALHGPVLSEPCPSGLESLGARWGNRRFKMARTRRRRCRPRTSLQAGGAAAGGRLGDDRRPGGGSTRKMRRFLKTAEGLPIMAVKTTHPAGRRPDGVRTHTLRG